MSREPTKETEGSARFGRAPGQVTGPAQEALKGDATAPERLYALVAPRLRAIARRHLENTTGELDLSPEEIASLTMRAFVGTADFDLRSREQFFEFADRVAASIVEQAAVGGIADTDLLLDTSKNTRKEAALGQAIREITRIDSDLAQVLRSRYVLNLGPTDLAKLRGEPEAAARKRWKKAEALLSRRYKDFERGDADPSSLDTGGGEGYPGADPVTSHPLPADSESPAAQPAAVAALQRENAQLRTELAEARERVAALEAQLGPISGPDTSETRRDIDALLSPSTLDEVPLFTGRTSEELFRHLEEQYGRWLAHFGAERDAISLDQIRRHDPQFVDKLSQRISRLRKTERERDGEARTPTLGEIMPTEVDRGDLALVGKTVEELFSPANRDLAALVCGRLRRHLFGQ